MSENSTSQASNSDPIESESSEWYCFSERIRERLTEESLILYPVQASRAGEWFPRSREPEKSGHYHVNRRVVKKDAL